LGDEIENILGLKNRKLIYDIYTTQPQGSSIAQYVFREKNSDEYINAYHPVEISGGYHSLLVYTDIVYPSLIGDVCAQILRLVEVPRKSRFSEDVTIYYENPQYRPLMLNEFETIEISIKDDTGALIPFKFGRVTLTLHLKKV
jgi:hypothetical protein